jgi:hypothetical protein
MRQTRRPSLESLESRWVPATIRLVAGNLFVSNQSAVALTVETTGVAGQIKITDGAKVVTVNGVGSLISITGTNKLDVISFRADAGGFAGNVLINAQNGSDTIALRAASAAGIGGNVTVLGGNGDDVVGIGATTLIRGGLMVSDNVGSNQFLPAAALTVRGNLSLLGCNKLVSPNPIDVGGSMTLRSSRTIVPGTYNYSLGQLTVAKDVTFITGPERDLIFIDNLTSIGGNCTFDVGDGANGLSLGGSAAVDIGGNLTYRGIRGGAVALNLVTIGGNTTIDTAEGAAFSDTTSSVYSGNLSFIHGNRSSFTGIAGTVAGDLNWTVGNSAVPLDHELFLTGPVGGKIRVRAGNGTNIVRLLPTAARTDNVDMLFGTGTNTLILNSDLTLTGTVVGTGGTNTFTQNGATLLPTLQLINFP